MSFDIRGFHIFNQLAGHHAFIDNSFAFLAKYALELYVVLFIIAWLTLPKSEIEQRHALVIMGLAGVLGLMINVIVSHIYFRPRPFMVLPKGTFTQLIPHSPDASFPSDHTTAIHLPELSMRTWASRSGTCLMATMIFMITGLVSRCSSLQFYVLGDHIETVANCGAYCWIIVSFVKGWQDSVQVKMFVELRDISEGQSCCPSDERVGMPQEGQTILLRPAPIPFIPSGAV